MTCPFPNFLCLYLTPFFILNIAMLGNVRSRQQALYSPTVKWLRDVGIISHDKEERAEALVKHASQGNVLSLLKSSTPKDLIIAEAPPTNMVRQTPKPPPRNIQLDSPLSKWSSPIPILSPAGTCSSAFYNSWLWEPASQ